MKPLLNIFLSASVPRRDRDPLYFKTADVVAIRDAVRALATEVLPEAHLYWGGHPSITPLVRDVLFRITGDVREHMSLYQSLYYKHEFPESNAAFEQIVLTPAMGDKPGSVAEMRRLMLDDKHFAAGVFIGGMDGVEAEFEMFRARYPGAPVWPVATTGGAALLLYNRLRDSGQAPPTPLAGDYAYRPLFRQLLRTLV